MKSCLLLFVCTCFVVVCFAISYKVSKIVYDEKYYFNFYRELNKNPCEVDAQILSSPSAEKCSNHVLGSCNWWWSSSKVMSLIVFHISNPSYKNIHRYMHKYGPICCIIVFGNTITSKKMTRSKYKQGNDNCFRAGLSFNNNESCMY